MVLSSTTRLCQRLVSHRKNNTIVDTSGFVRRTDGKFKYYEIALPELSAGSPGQRYLRRHPRYAARPAIGPIEGTRANNAGNSRSRSASQTDGSVPVRSFLRRICMSPFRGKQMPTGGTHCEVNSSSGGASAAVSHKAKLSLVAPGRKSGLHALSSDCHGK